MLDSAQAWTARVNNANQWMQIDLGNLTNVTGVVTQGRANSNQWVTNYRVSTSTNGEKWVPMNSGQQYAGNTDRSTKVMHKFAFVSARYVRFDVLAWNGYISMRAGVIVASGMARCILNPSELGFR